MASRWLLKVDDRQVWVVAALVLPMQLAALALCILDHYAPWSKITFGALQALLVASILLRGMWRMEIWLEPALATLALISSIILYATAPHHWLPVLPQVALDAAPMFLGIWLWYRICLTTDYWPEEWLEGHDRHQEESAQA